MIMKRGFCLKGRKLIFKGVETKCSGKYLDVRGGNVKRKMNGSACSVDETVALESSRH
jgi:hypothetical protein